MQHRRLIALLVVVGSCVSPRADAAASSQREGNEAKATTLPTFPARAPSTQASDLGARVLDSVDLNRVPLRDAIERLRTQAGVNLFVSWNVLSHAGVDPTTPVDAKLSNVPLGRVLDLILSDAAGGDGKLAWAVEDGVIRISTAADLERAAMLRREQKEWAQEMRAQARLDEQIPTLRLDRMPLWQAIDTVSSQSGVKIDVPWQTLKDVGIGRSAPISVDLNHPTTRAALTAILDAATEGGVPLGFALRGDTIEVATRASLRRMTDMRVYDVSDLISLAAPSTRGDATREKSKAGDKIFHDAEDVARWLKETVDPESWRDSRGGYGDIRVLSGRYSGLIAVTQTEDNHREIRRVLNTLRELRPPDDKTQSAAPASPPAAGPSR